MSGRGAAAAAVLALVFSTTAGAQGLLLSPTEPVAQELVRTEPPTSSARLLLGQTDDHAELAARAAGMGFFIHMAPSRLEFMKRTGYGQGLPIPEDVAKLDEALTLKSNGVIVMGAGPLTWLHVEVESFRELAGARRYKFVALPGLVIKPLRQVPIQCGVSMVLAFKRRPDAYSDERRRATGFFQLSGRF